MQRNIFTMHSAASATANGSSLDVEDYSIAAFQITGTFVATITFEGTVDNINWVSVETINIATGAKATTATAAGIYRLGVGSLLKVRARLTWTSGTSITVIGILTNAADPLLYDGNMPDGGDVAQGTTTDAAASSSVAEDTTARTGIGLWKGVKNILILLNAKLTALGQAAMAASMPVVIASNQSAVAVTPGAQEVHLGEIGGPHSVVSATFARPADTTAYTAKDVVGNTGAAANLTFTNIARVNAGSGIICKARLMSDNKALVGRYRLHIFNVAPTPIADNSPYLLLYANAAYRIGTIDFAAMATEDATNSTASMSLDTDIRLAFTCAAASRTLYGILETLDAYTPVASTNMYIELEAEVN